MDLISAISMRRFIDIRNFQANVKFDGSMVIFKLFMTQPINIIAFFLCIIVDFSLPL